MSDLDGHEMKIGFPGGGRRAAVDGVPISVGADHRHERREAVSAPQRLDTSPAGLVARATGELRQGAYREATATALVAIAAMMLDGAPTPGVPPGATLLSLTDGQGGSPVWLRQLVANTEELAGLRPRVKVDEDGQLDDFFATNVESVHFEALDDRNWYLSVVLADGQVWQLNFGAENGRGKGYARAEQVS